MGEAGLCSGPPALAGLGQRGTVRVEGGPRLRAKLGHRDPYGWWVLRLSPWELGGTFSHLLIHEDQVQVLPCSPFLVF